MISLLMTRGHLVLALLLWQATLSHLHAQVLVLDGSSTVFPITEAAAEEFRKVKQDNIKITAGISGTGGGFRKFCTGETDIHNASRPISAVEIAACEQRGIEFIELPVAFDALTVVSTRKIIGEAQCPSAGKKSASRSMSF